MAAIFDLNHHASYVHWHFIDVSVSNVVVIVLMVVVFFAAVLVPFPSGRGSAGGSS
jgi:hypothetical protein